jgi:hypothetical protein
MAFRSKEPSLVKMYEACLKLADDPTSEMYHEGFQRTGSGIRCAFWDGYNGMTRSAHVIPGTLSAACFAAGKDFRKKQDKAGKPVIPAIPKLFSR